MSLWKYKYFVDVVDSKSFTKAGKKNFVSQTAVSQQISSLEKSIGGKLIDRGSGGIEPTELGRIVYGKAKQILYINEEMFREIKKYKSKSKVEFGVDCSMNRSFWRIVEKMLDVYYPETKDDYHFNKIDARTGSQMLKEASLDIFIGYDIYNVNRGEIEEKVLCENKIGVFLGASSSLKHKKELTLCDLEGYNRYETKVYSCSRQPGVQFSGEQIEDECVKCEDNLDTLKLKVEFNDGFAFVDSQYFSYDDGELRTLEDFEKTCSLKFFYKKDGDKKRIEEVFEHLQALIKNNEKQ